MKHNIAIIIQGQFTQECLKYIDIYTASAQVIVSCYNSCNTATVPSNVIVVKQAKNEIKNCHNGHNLYQQALTTYNGLLLAQEYKYAIKVRSDEYFENMSHIIHRITNSPDKLLTTSFFFGTHTPFHISDHLIGGTTSSLTQAFHLITKICEAAPPCSDADILHVNNLDNYIRDNINMYKLGFGKTSYLCNEQIIYLCWLIGAGYKIDFLNYRQQMIDTLNLISYEELGDFRLVSNRQYIDARSPSQARKLPYTTSLEQIVSII